MRSAALSVSGLVFGISQMAVTPPKTALATSKASTGKVISWAMWDWGTQPFATVITTFVFSTHDPQVLEYAKRVVRMRDGHLVPEA